MLEAMQFIATLSTALFAGGAIYISFVEYPALMSRSMEIAAIDWAVTSRRILWLKWFIPALSFIAGSVAWLAGGGAVWIVGALLIGVLAPFEVLAVGPTSGRLFAAAREPDGPVQTRQLLERWGELQRVHGVASVLATGIMVYGLQRA